METKLSIVTAAHTNLDELHMMLQWFREVYEDLLPKLEFGIVYNSKALAPVESFQKLFEQKLCRGFGRGPQHYRGAAAGGGG
jgi:hypothetical protein